MYHQQYDIWICLKVYHRACLKCVEIMKLRNVPCSRKETTRQNLTNLAFAPISVHPTLDATTESSKSPTATLLQFWYPLAIKHGNGKSPMNQENH